MFGFSKKQLIIMAVLVVVVIRFRGEIGKLLANIPVVNKIAGVAPPAAA